MMSSETRSRPLPGDRIRISTDTNTEPFWQAAKARKLVAAQCGECGTFRMPPHPYCPACHNRDTTWPELPGTATIYSFAVCTKSPYPDVPDFTYIPIVITLDGAPGIRLISNLVDANPEEVQIGDRLTVDWHPIQDGWVLPVFRQSRR